MDDTARLVTELHGKLAELDGRVAAYRRDMVAEFHRHMDECLQKYPEHVSNEVSRVIAESMSAGRYPALNPPARDAVDSPATDSNAWNGRKSPPPVLRHTSGTPKDSPRSPHAREKEFQGLFTPTYLPLLENNDRAFSSPPMSPPPSAEGPSLTLTADNVKKVEEVKQTLPVARDAVRFEFEGEEVFPASCSPKEPPTIPAVESGEETQLEVEAPVVVTEDESTEYSGTSLLDVEGEEDWVPRPKKVSSTQALQALTRSPLEEGTVWTEVNSDPEELVEMNGDEQPEGASSMGAKVDSQATVRALDVHQEHRNGRAKAPAQEPTRYDDEDASDNEFLSMRPKGKSPSPAATSPFARPVQSPATTPKAKATATVSNGHDDIDDSDPLFDFDDEAGPSTSAKYLPDTHDSSEDEETTTARRLRTLALNQTGTEASTSTATTKLPPVSPSAVLFGHSVGSYMGRSMTIAPIKDPKLYDEIAGMKDVNFFVGSIDDVSAAEAATMGSYRPSSSGLARGGRAGGEGFAPRSFTERLAMEEEMERRAAMRGINSQEEEDY
ncbi:hypothetical protein NEMBOFW57_000836 [Staphylotrichum longicolle]|uniref:Uncharacterized protein n=1 Tax=Staphylotrichum longicolle TaxID=669026 RepID=A0AAD4F033_9PEZI|nr:hypothetical protein NEMBOFW57_000836 [Staphylotrichum longicolle]